MTDQDLINKHEEYKMQEYTRATMAINAVECLKNDLTVALQRINQLEQTIELMQKQLNACLTICKKEFMKDNE